MTVVIVDGTWKQALKMASFLCGKASTADASTDGAREAGPPERSAAQPPSRRTLLERPLAAIALDGSAVAAAGASLFAPLRAQSQEGRCSTIEAVVHLLRELDEAAADTAARGGAVAASSMPAKRPPFHAYLRRRLLFSLRVMVDRLAKQGGRSGLNPVVLSKTDAQAAVASESEHVVFLGYGTLPPPEPRWAAYRRKVDAMGAIEAAEAASAGGGGVPPCWGGEEERHAALSAKAEAVSHGFFLPSRLLRRAVLLYILGAPSGSCDAAELELRGSEPSAGCCTYCVVRQCSRGWKRALPRLRGSAALPPPLPPAASSCGMQAVVAEGGGVRGGGGGHDGGGGEGQRALDEQVQPRMVRPPPPVTPKQVIFDPASFFKRSDTTVTGTVVLLDTELGRMDVSGDGAKLIVQIAALDPQSVSILRLGAQVSVTGCVKKQNRRTFLEAQCAVAVSGGE